MQNPTTTAEERTDDRHKERQDADPAPDAVACGAAGCQRDADLALVNHPDYGQRVLCRYHRKHYLEVSS